MINWIRRKFGKKSNASEWPKPTLVIDPLPKGELPVYDREAPGGIVDTHDVGNCSPRAVASADDLRSHILHLENELKKERARSARLENILAETHGILVKP